MADRFYCPASPVDGRATLEGDEARHLARVRRVAVGECVELFDGKGLAFQAEVESLGRDQVSLRVVRHLESCSVPTCKLTLATAVPKGDRFDWLVEKATELGVDSLVPLTTDRSSVDPRATKLDRLRRAVIESAKQCRRDQLMELAPQVAWSKLVQTQAVTHRFIADPSGLPLARSVSPGRNSQAILAIGPEGGFTPEEVANAVASGWKPVSLGAQILRIETAALAGAAVLLALAEACDATQ